jgi:hypothetical protein
MKIAILCPGPSLPLFEGRGPDYSQVLAINRACLLFPADFWVMLDGDAFRSGAEVMQRPSWPPDRLPVLVSFADQHAARCHRWSEARRLPFIPVEYDWLPHDWEPAPGAPKQPLLWDTFSATTALVLAKRLGAVQVDVYGADQAGPADWDGYTHADYARAEDRWTRERDLWRDLVKYFAGVGMTIRRIAAAETSP